MGSSALSATESLGRRRRFEWQFFLRPGLSRANCCSILNRLRLGESDTHGLRAAIFISRSQGTLYQFSETFKVVNVAVTETERQRRKCLEQPNHAVPTGKGHCHHGAHPQASARLQVHALVYFCIFTAHNLCSAKADL